MDAVLATLGYVAYGLVVVVGAVVILSSSAATTSESIRARE